MRDMDANPSDILPYPLQNALTRPLRNAGGRAGDIDVLSLWAGQGAPMARRERRRTGAPAGRGDRRGPGPALIRDRFPEGPSAGRRAPRPTDCP